MLLQECKYISKNYPPVKANIVELQILLPTPGSSFGFLASLATLTQTTLQTVFILDASSRSVTVVVAKCDIANQTATLDMIFIYICLPTLNAF